MLEDSMLSLTPTCFIVRDRLFQSAPTTSPLIWRQRGPAIVGGEYDRLGTSVAMSKNATTMVIGAPGYNNYTGYVKVYCKVADSDNWAQLGLIIYGNATDDYFGSFVDISADGTTIICGSPGSCVNDRPGYVRVFNLVSNSDIIDSNAWVQIGQNITG
jgi:hypothetical protein